jgi:hypothetical protein
MNRYRICRGYVFDQAVDRLREIYGDEQIVRIAVTGEPQRLTEIAYLDEIRNLGYEPVKERDEKKAKSFFHMMNWLKSNPDKLAYAKMDGRVCRDTNCSDQRVHARPDRTKARACNR